MAEFRDPSQKSDESKRFFVGLMIVLACMFLGLHWFSLKSGTGVHLSHVQENATKVTEADRSASGSMNIAEQELFVALGFVHDHIVVGWSGSWGWAIVLLTVGINLLLLPLRISSMQSGLKMQRIQPHIEAI